MLIQDTIIKEKNRIEFMIEEYKKMHSELPKGSLSKKTSGSKSYYYLKYRDGEKVISKYIRNEDIAAVESSIMKRKHIESMLKSLKEELRFAEKALGGVSK